MKTSVYGFLLTGIVLLLSISLCAQTNTSWFTVNEVSEKVWVISDHNIDNIYLIEGKDSALLVDTGIGVADLVSAVKKLTDKPLIVVNTHGHPDHCGANYQFEKVYIHPAIHPGKFVYSTFRTNFFLPEIITTALSGFSWMVALRYQSIW